MEAAAEDEIRPFEVERYRALRLSNPFRVQTDLIQTSRTGRCTSEWRALTHPKCVPSLPLLSSLSTKPTLYSHFARHIYPGGAFREARTAVRRGSACVAEGQSRREDGVLSAHLPGPIFSRRKSITPSHRTVKCIQLRTSFDLTSSLFRFLFFFLLILPRSPSQCSHRVSCPRS